MAWNRGSDNEKEIKAGNGMLRIFRMKFSARLLCAASAVPIVGAAVFFVFHTTGGSGANSGAEKHGTGLIPEAKPATNTVQYAEPPVIPPKKKSYKDMSRDEKLKYWRDKYGDNLPDNVKPIVYYLENEPKVNYKPEPGPESIFKYSSERQIASFLLVEPGTWMMRPTEFGAKFDKDLLLSIQDKIKILPTDTDEQRRLKEAVMATKKDLLERAKDGENPSQIMTDFSKDLYQMGQYRRDLESEIRSIKNDPSASNADVALAVEAANKMLAKKGLKPIRQPNMLIRNVNLRRIRGKQIKSTISGRESK